MFGGKLGVPELLLIGIITAPFALMLLVKGLRGITGLNPRSGQNSAATSAPLVRRCQRCSTSLAAGARFCPNCGVES